MNGFTSYLEKYALIALEKQAKLDMLVGEHFAELDLDSGILRLDKELAIPFQVLGTESDNTLTWLWAWSDAQEELPEHLLSSSLQLRAWGIEKGLQEFTSPEVDLNKADGHMISMIASGILPASCYYRDQYEGGAAFLLLSSDVIDKQSPLDTESLIRQLSDLVTRYELDHRAVLLSYLHLKGLTIHEQGSTISSELASGESLSAEFDESGRLVAMNGKTLVE